MAVNHELIKEHFVKLSNECVPLLIEISQCQGEFTDIYKVECHNFLINSVNKFVLNVKQYIEVSDYPQKCWTEAYMKFIMAFQTLGMKVNFPAEIPTAPLPLAQLKQKHSEVNFAEVPTSTTATPLAPKKPYKGNILAKNKSSQMNIVTEKTDRMDSLNFQNYVARVVPEFDGNSIELQRFIDALELVDLNSGDFMAEAVLVVKTKLKGTARSNITNERTIRSIIDTLLSAIKTESPSSLKALMMNNSQFKKSAATYVKEMQFLSESMKTAFIHEGVPPHLAETYSLREVVSAIIANTFDKDTKIILKASNFTSFTEIADRFVQCSNDKIFENRFAKRDKDKKKDFQNNKQKDHKKHGNGQQGQNKQQNVHFTSSSNCDSGNVQEHQ